MGQNQLLLIVLGTIIAGIAVIAGMSITAASSDQSNRDAVLSDLNHLASLARAHFMKPAEMGGGGYSFANFTIPDELKESENGTIEHFNEDHKPDHIHFRAVGKAVGENGVDPIKFEVRMKLSETKLSIKN